MPRSRRCRVVSLLFNKGIEAIMLETFMNSIVVVILVLFYVALVN